VVSLKQYHTNHRILGVNCPDLLSVYAKEEALFIKTISVRKRKNTFHQEFFFHLYSNNYPHMLGSWEEFGQYLYPAPLLYLERLRCYNGVYIHTLMRTFVRIDCTWNVSIGMGSFILIIWDFGVLFLHKGIFHNLKRHAWYVLKHIENRWLNK